MKIIFIAFTTIRGGAAKAAVRIQNILQSSTIETDFISIENNSGKTPFYYLILHYFVWIFSHLISKFQRSNNTTKHSLNIFGNRYIRNMVENSNFLHIHWINNETLSIKDFPLFSNKSVITLHDEWFYCGAEHHALDICSYKRVVEGYNKSNKNVQGIDLNRLVWRRKIKYYPLLTGVIFTVPSTWMKSRAEESYLLRNKDIRVVPNPIDTQIFINDKTAFSVDGIEPNDFVITFGAIDGGGSAIKGFDLLIDAIQLFAESLDLLKNIKIITFGGKNKNLGKLFGINTIELGHISSERELANIYSLSSVTIVPSRAESFGQVAAESLSCETPVIAFNHSGLTDIVKHKENGYLAEPFKPTSLAAGISWFYSLNEAQRSYLGISGRKHVLKSFSENVIADKFISIYQELGYKDN